MFSIWPLGQPSLLLGLARASLARAFLARASLMPMRPVRRKQRLLACPPCTMRARSGLSSRIGSKRCCC